MHADDVPSLDSPATARSTLNEGVPYILVCNDGTGVEALNAVVIHHLGP